MVEEHVSQELMRDAGGPTAQKPRYEAPAVLDLSGPARGAAGICMDGSSDFEECHDGTTAHYDCYEGYGY